MEIVLPRLFLLYLMPSPVVSHLSSRFSIFQHCLAELIESQGIAVSDEARVLSADDPLSQISFSDMQADEIRDTLRQTDLNTLTPLEALNLLYTLQRKAMQ